MGNAFVEERDFKKSHHSLGERQGDLNLASNLCRRSCNVLPSAAANTTVNWVSVMGETGAPSQLIAVIDENGPDNNNSPYIVSIRSSDWVRQTVSSILADLNPRHCQFPMKTQTVNHSISVYGCLAAFH